MESARRILSTDKDWAVIEGVSCRVIKFTPMASVQDSKVIALSKSTPYASVTLELKQAPELIDGFITNKVDFRHLWAAFIERPLGVAEEVLIIWTDKHYKNYAKLFHFFMPKLWVMVCPKGAYEILNYGEHRPELKGEGRFLASRPIVDWKPPVME